MKKQMGYKAILLAIFLSVFSYCQAQQWVYNDTKSNIKITFGYKLQLQEKDSALSVSVVIADNTQDYDYGSYYLNKNNVLNKDSLAAMLSASFRTFQEKYGAAVMSRHFQSFSLMMADKKSTLGSRDQHSFVYQGLLLFGSLLNAANRSQHTEQQVVFSPFEGYISAISAFSCEEEMIYNIAETKTYFLERQKWDKTNVGIDYYLGALRNETAVTLTLAEIRIRLERYFEERDFTGRWPQGGQCGCCGNYSGNCYFWSLACLAHDAACQRCQHSWCFSGCVPSSCSGNSISWYWYLL